VEIHVDIQSFMHTLEAIQFMLIEMDNEKDKKLSSGKDKISSSGDFCF